MRLKIFRVIITLSFLGIVAGLIHTQLILGSYYYLLSKNNSIRIIPLEGRRGIIKDRNGVVVAGNRLAFDVAVIPQEVKDKEKLFSYLSAVLKADKEKLAKKYRLKKTAPFIPVVITEDVDRDVAITLEENKFRYPGLFIQADSRRYYPFNEGDAHLVGYVGKINRSKVTELKDYGYTVQNIVGYSGVEEYYDSYLKAEDGGLQVEVNSRGQQVRLLGLRNSTSGEDVQLTVDNRIQQMATEALGGRKGAVVMMDLDSGEVLGLVSSPAFDPNAFASGPSKQEMIQKWFSDGDFPMLNRAISGSFPPGSTFKIPLAIGALENDKIKPETSFECPGYYLLGKRSFRCSHVHGVQNLMEGIAHSCNVYFFNTGRLCGPDLIAKYAKLFGLGSLTNIDLPGEKEGFIPSPGHRLDNRTPGWHDGDTLNFSIGQGDVLTTPIQMMCMIAMVAKDGEYTHPYVIKAIGGSDVEMYFPRRRVDISQHTLDIVKTGLRATVGDYAGTAHLLDLKDIAVMGKTGTAQTSGGRAPHAWFAGWCPSSKTKIVFCIFLEHGGSSYNACLVARTLLLKMKEAKIL